jgi:hypothetical protein
MNPIAAFFGLLVPALLLAACGTSRPPEPDRQFGHRYEDRGPEGRQTVLVEPPPDPDAYFTYPAYFDTVNVRVAPFGPGATAVPVEILVMGSLPDACMELSEVSQERLGNLINVSLMMRRPKGAICAQVVRPFRFYLELDGAFEPGPYTLKINDSVHPFDVRRPARGT